ncbi:hypothetical protein [Ciceribacter selenitireducens]
MQDELNIYRLVPLAEPDDPNWQNSPYQGEVLVRARTTGDARVVAMEAEGDFLQSDAKPAEGVSTTNGSAFTDEKLYTVVREENSRHTRHGPRGVLEGKIADPVLADRPD